ncbi:MAG: hypothetical protein K1X28_00860 [Parachlamydiales bacterium]|nr:hypothetical protein [Parachlamydiales bacterium]
MAATTTTNGESTYYPQIWGVRLDDYNKEVEIHFVKPETATRIFERNSTRLSNTEVSLKDRVLTIKRLGYEPSFEEMKALVQRTIGKIQWLSINHFWQELPSEKKSEWVFLPHPVSSWF